MPHSYNSTFSLWEAKCILFFVVEIARIIIAGVPVLGCEIQVFTLFRHLAVPVE